MDSSIKYVSRINIFDGFCGKYINYWKTDISMRDQSNLNMWDCNSCKNNFALLAQFGTPNYCPNCGSEDIEPAQTPDRNPYPNPQRPKWPPNIFM
jgi:predicted RNA-binding Zn-ribbon protein involved in translation (DUF1610 family)